MIGLYQYFLKTRESIMNTREKAAFGGLFARRGVPGGDWATQMIDPDNTYLKYCIVNNTDHGGKKFSSMHRHTQM